MKMNKNTKKMVNKVKKTVTKHVNTVKAKVADSVDSVLGTKLVIGGQIDLFQWHGLRVNVSKWSMDLDLGIVQAWVYLD